MTKEEYFILYKQYEHPPSTLFHKHVSKRGARFLTFYLVKYKISPNFLTIFSFLLIILAVIVLNLFNGGIRFFYFIILTQLSYIIDCSDGVVARIRNLTSNFGAFLDLTLDRISGFIFFIGIGTYLYSTFSKQTSAEYILYYSCFSLCYLIYPLSTTLLELHFSHLKGYIKKSNSQKNLVHVIRRILYEFIDTGTMYFAFGLGLLSNLGYLVTIFYGSIGLVLTVGLMLFLYLKQKKIIKE